MLNAICPTTSRGRGKSLKTSDVGEDEIKVITTELINGGHLKPFQGLLRRLMQNAAPDKQLAAARLYLNLARLSVPVSGARFFDSFAYADALLVCGRLKRSAFAVPCRPTQHHPKPDWSLS